MPVPELPNPSDHDRDKLLGAPVLRLPSSPGPASVAMADLDALGATIGCSFDDSAARYSYGSLETGATDGALVQCRHPIRSWPAIGFAGRLR